MRWIALILAAWMAVGVAHADDWYEASTPRVRVIAEDDDRARELAEKLERFDAALRLMRGLEASDHGPAGRLTVYVVGSTSRIARLANAGSVAGFYVPRAGGSVAFVPARGTAGGQFALDAESVLFHEYAHHFMFRHFPSGYPAWFTEGFAEFHATADIDRDGTIEIGRPPMYRAYGLMSAWQLPIERLLDPGEKQLRSSEIDNLYGRGWLLTHLLTFSEERKGQLSRYLTSLRAGESSLTAAQAAFGDLDTLDRDLDRYTRQRLTAIRIAPEHLPIPPIKLRRMSEAESAVMEVRIESTSGVTREEALKLLPKARRAAAPYPNDAFAQGVLAEAEYDAGYYDAAKNAALRAVAADPQSRQGLIYHGMALAALAEEAEDRSPDTFRAVIAPWMQANRRDPDDPRPMALIYFAAREFDVDNQSIVDGIKYAQRMAPEDRGLRMAAAGEYLRAGEVDDARPLIASLAYDRHAGNREQMAALLALIDSGDAQAAFAALSAANEAREAEEEADGADDADE